MYPLVSSLILACRVLGMEPRKSCVLSKRGHRAPTLEAGFLWVFCLFVFPFAETGPDRAAPTLRLHRRFLPHQSGLSLGRPALGQARTRVTLCVPSPSCGELRPARQGTIGPQPAWAPHPVLRLGPRALLLPLVDTGGSAFRWSRPAPARPGKGFRPPKKTPAGGEIQSQKILPIKTAIKENESRHRQERAGFLSCIIHSS